MQLMLKWAQTAHFFEFDLFNLSNIVFGILKSFERTKCRIIKTMISELDFYHHLEIVFFDFFVEFLKTFQSRLWKES